MCLGFGEHTHSEVDMPSNRGLLCHEVLTMTTTPHQVEFKRHLYVIFFSCFPLKDKPGIGLMFGIRECMPEPTHINLPERGDCVFTKY